MLKNFFYLYIETECKVIKLLKYKIYNISPIEENVYITIFITLYYFFIIFFCELLLLKLFLSNSV